MDYKKVGNHNKGTGSLEKEYFVFTKQECKDLNLPPKFDEDVLEAMLKWLKHKPTINSPHHCGLFHPDDGTYSTKVGDSEDFEDRSQANPLYVSGNYGQEEPVIDIASDFE